MVDIAPVNRPALVLIANDQEWSARSLETILQPQGYVVVRAYNIRQTIELTRSAQPDVVILEARLPDGDGIELCQTLRNEAYLGPTTPIFITTSDPSNRGQQIAAYRAGAWEYWTLPLDGEILLRKLYTFMQAKREADRLGEEGLLDQLTGLYNARGLARRAREIGAEAYRRRAPLACVAFAPTAQASTFDERDLDDRVGQIAGHVGGIIARAGRTSDAIGRLGQSEFAIIAPATEAAGAVRLAERVQEVVEAAPITVGGDARQVRLRVGYYAVSDFAESSVDAVEMLIRAAAALRQPTSPGDSAIRAFEEAAIASIF